MVLRCWLYSILLHGALVPGAGGRVPGVLKSVLAVVGIHVPMISAALCLQKILIPLFRALCLASYVLVAGGTRISYQEGGMPTRHDFDSWYGTGTDLACYNSKSS